LPEALGWSAGRAGASGEIGERRKILGAASFVAALNVAACALACVTTFIVIFVAAAVFAAIITNERLAAIGCMGAMSAGSKIFAREIFGMEIFTMKIFAMRILAPRILAMKIVAGSFVDKRSVTAEIVVMQVAEIRQDGLRLNLTLAQGGEIVGDGFFFVETDLAGVGAYETFVEYAAGELVEVLVLECAEHAGADFRCVGDGVERDVALFALLAKFFSERTHGWLRRTGLSFRPHRDENNHRRRRREMPPRVSG
jgi:hypothetical protein